MTDQKQKSSNVFLIKFRKQKRDNKETRENKSWAFSSEKEARSVFTCVLQSELREYFFDDSLNVPNFDKWFDKKYVRIGSQNWMTFIVKPIRKPRNIILPRSPDEIEMTKKEMSDFIFFTMEDKEMPNF